MAIRNPGRCPGLCACWAFSPSLPKSETLVYLAIKHMALTSLTSLNSLTSTFAKVEFFNFSHEAHSFLILLHRLTQIKQLFEISYIMLTKNNYLVKYSRICK